MKDENGNLYTGDSEIECRFMYKGKLPAINAHQWRCQAEMIKENNAVIMIFKKNPSLMHQWYPKLKKEKKLAITLFVIRSCRRKRFVFVFLLF